MSTTLRKLQLKLLKKAGVKYLKATSNFKVPYIVCMGDYFSENPFIAPDFSTEEIVTCVAWCIEENKPVIFDIGAHCGYLSTHFAALLKKNDPHIYSFEPVAQTYSDLLLTINRLGLNENVFPIHAALSHTEGIVAMNYSRWLSMLAQVITDDKSTEKKQFTLATTIDKAVKTLEVFPNLIKLDVEGYESFVLEGAHGVLNAADKPAICIEWNPETLRQCGSSAVVLASLLSGYEIYYLNDYELGKKKFLEKINDITAIPWVCNLFALPPGDRIFEKWKANIERVKSMYNISIKYI